MSSLKLNAMKRQEGFTLVELAVVIIIIGVLSAFAVPRFRNSVERAKASEAFNYLTSIRSAQERYHARNGQYSKWVDGNNLDIDLGWPKYFKVGRVKTGKTGTLQSSWSLTLTRKGASAGYGKYTVVWTESGFDRKKSSIAKLDKINPMGR